MAPRAITAAQPATSLLECCLLECCLLARDIRFQTCGSYGGAYERWRLYSVKGSQAYGPLRIPISNSETLYQLRDTKRGFCLTVPYSQFRAGVSITPTFPCSTATNRLWTVKRGVAP